MKPTSARPQAASEFADRVEQDDGWHFWQRRGQLCVLRTNDKPDAFDQSSDFVEAVEAVAERGSSARLGCSVRSLANTSRTISSSGACVLPATQIRSFAAMPSCSPSRLVCGLLRSPALRRI